MDIRTIALIAMIVGAVAFFDEIEAFVGTPEDRCAWAEEKLSGTESQSGESFWGGYRDATCD